MGRGAGSTSRQLRPYSRRETFATSTNAEIQPLPAARPKASSWPLYHESKQRPSSSASTKCAARSTIASQKTSKALRVLTPENRNKKRKRKKKSHGEFVGPFHHLTFLHRAMGRPTFCGGQKKIRLLYWRIIASAVRGARQNPPWRLAMKAKIDLESIE